MLKFWFAALLFAVAVFAHSQNPAASAESRRTIQKLLGFEEQRDGPAPTGWYSGPQGSIFADSQVVHSGKWAARLERTAKTPDSFSTITTGIPVDFSGTTIELRGFLRLKDVSDFAGLWLREDGEGGEALQFDNMQSREVKGTRDWTEYSIQLPLDPGARLRSPHRWRRHPLGRRPPAPRRRQGYR